MIKNLNQLRRTLREGTQLEIVQYLKERRLYVNEPVESEAEV